MIDTISLNLHYKQKEEFFILINFSFFFKSLLTYVALVCRSNFKILQVKIWLNKDDDNSRLPLLLLYSLLLIAILQLEQESGDPLHDPWALPS
jgi:hypothetical protein